MSAMENPLTTQRVLPMLSHKDGVLPAAVHLSSASLPASVKGQTAGKTQSSSDRLTEEVTDFSTLTQMSFYSPLV